MRKTLNDYWREYRDSVYPQGTQPDQNRECHQAFMAGVFIALTHVSSLSNCPDTDTAEAAAAGEIGAMLNEATEWMRLRGAALNSPRN
jgi:hypothetical protein